MENSVISSGENKVDVVPLGTNRLFHLIHDVIAREGGRVTRALSQGQNTPYL